MECKVSKSALQQYILIYLIFIMTGSRVWCNAFSRTPQIALGIEFFVLSIFVVKRVTQRSVYRCQYNELLIVFLLGVVAFVRFNVGGAGITVWLEWCTYICVAWMAIAISPDTFRDRFVRMVYIFALISLVGFIFQTMFPAAIKSILPQYDSNFSYNIWTSGSNYNTYSYKAWGRFFFSFDEMHSTKNVGIYSEPGCHQIVLNTALFILLFLPQFGQTISDKKMVRYFTVISMALITCQSTTGYIAYLTILLTYLISQKAVLNKYQNRIAIVVICFGLLIAVDYYINGTSSLIYRGVLSKLFSKSNQFDITASTGAYRLGTIISSISTMINHPLGVGYDQANMIISNYMQGSAGAVLLVTGAAIGVVPMLIIIWWTIYPVFKNKDFKLLKKWLFVFLFFNLELAQSEELYVGFIVIPMMFIYYNKHNLIGNESEWNEGRKEII